jgi:carbamoyl-phosphate synthase large subunit
MTQHRVLITGVGGNVGQGVVKSLRAGKLCYNIVGIDMEPMSAGFAFSDKMHIVPRTGSSEFGPEIENILRRDRPEAIFVCSPTELEYFSLNQDVIKKTWETTVLVNPIKVIHVGSDKLLTSEFLRDRGFPWLPTVMANDDRGVDQLIRDVGFPLIVKPRKGFSSHNVFLVDSRAEIEAVRNLVQDVIVQRYVPGDDEYTAGTLSGWDGRVRAVIILHRHLIQGTTYRTELVLDDKIRNMMVTIVEALGATGPCNIQFRMQGGEVYVFEINPRFSGTTGIRYIYGFNDAELAFELLHIGKDIEQPELNHAVVLRYWNEVVLSNVDFTSVREGRFNCRANQVSLNISDGWINS